MRNKNWSWFRWFLRNPFSNFHNTVIGVAHKDRDVCWSRSPWTFVPDGGWNYGLTFARWYPPLPFISYRCKRFEAMIGWKTSGAFGYALRLAYSPNAPEHP